MLRSLLRASAALAFAASIAPAGPSAAPAPPPGLAYDEIVRVVVGATPPPPGNFQADLAAIASPQTVADATPTPAPRKRGISLSGVGSLLKGDLGGAIASTVVGTAVDSAVERSMGSMAGQFAGLAAAARGLLQPHLMRYAYWNGWERVEDTTAQTVTIRKCDARQIIALDLAKKTYAVYDPNAEPSAAPAPAPPAQPRGRQAPDPQQPGTAAADLSSSTRTLPPLRIENQLTAGYDSTTTFATTQATGSCRDGSATIETVQYLAPVIRPAVNSCPVRRRAVPETAEYAVTPASGGCRPTFTAHRSGPVPPASRLALYSLVTFAAGPSAPTPAPGAGPSAAASGGLGFLTERGNLKTLGAADAGLFSVPQGFTKSP